jgi:BT_3987-like, N-terminal domain
MKIKRNNMKIKNKAKVFTVVLILSGVVLTLSSCLKNGKYYTDFASASASVNLPLAASNLNGVVAFSYDATETTVSLPVYVDVASPSVPSSATTVTLSLDTAFLDTYNTNNGTSFEVMPDSIYTTSGWTLTVPAGQRLDSMNVTFNFSKLDLSQAYILPITISQASVPIEQWNHLLLYISVKNQYDGVYTVTGTFSDVTNSAFTGYYPQTVDLVTSGPNSVDVTPELLGFPGYVFAYDAAGDLSYYGSFGARIFFDNSGNVTSVINVYGQPAGNTRSAQLDPSGINKFDSPNTGANLDIKYYMIQPSAVPTPPSIRSYFSEHYAYQGPR